MNIKVNGRNAIMKKGSSFDFVFENRLFTKSDSYTLSITFPLRGCPENMRVFGMLFRHDVDPGEVDFRCEITVGDFMRVGSLTVVEITEAELKAQFLEGRAEQNFADTFDKVYINELALEPWPDDRPAPSIAWHKWGKGNKCVALPWVNSESGNIQNNAALSPEQGTFYWLKETEKLSWMPYLKFLVEEICRATGYTIDLSEWVGTKYADMLVCNALPAAWDIPSFARALPHWTVAEFFTKLELFLNASFDIDVRGKKIDFSFNSRKISALPVVNIETVVDEFTRSIAPEEEDSDYIETKNLAYAEQSHEMQKFYSCRWLVEHYENIGAVQRFATFQEMTKAVEGYRTSYSGRNIPDKIYYVADLDLYFALRAVEKTLVQEYKNFPNVYQYRYMLQPLNELGPRIADNSEDAQEEEIEFVPAWIDVADIFLIDKEGKKLAEKECPVLFLDCKGFDEAERDDFDIDEYGKPMWFAGKELIVYSKSEIEELNSMFVEPPVMTCLANGEEKEKAEYYDKIFIGYWSDGDFPENSAFPHPYVSEIEIDKDWNLIRVKRSRSLRLNSEGYADDRGMPKIVKRCKSSFSWIADTVPDPMSVFIIKGKRYLCQKITATVSDTGMGKIIKGDFYRVQDES